MTIQGLNEQIILDAGNNNVITFYADSIPANETQSKASISIGGYEFLVTPIGEVFTFNFKEIFRTLSDSNLLEQVRSGDVSSNDSVLMSNVVIVVTFSDNTTEQTNVDYYYSRSVQQIGQYIARSIGRTNLLGQTSIKVWKNYPSSVLATSIGSSAISVNGTSYTTSGDCQEITLSGYSALLKERMTYYESCTSKGTDSILLNEGDNVVTIGGATLNVQYIDKCDGVYLKWANKKGGYSYWLFNDIYFDDKTTKTRDRYTQDFANIDVANRSFAITGKDSALARKLRTDLLTTNDVDTLRDLLDSPQVLLYNGLESNEMWQEVYLRDGVFNVKSTKRNFVYLKVTIELNEYSL